MILAQLRVLLQLDDSQYAADIKKAQRETLAWGRRMERIGRALTMGVTAPLVGMGLAGVKAASDLNEAMNKVEVVFGDAANEVRRFASTAADSVGMSAREALEAAGTFGNLFTSMGMARRSAAEMSVELVKLAADLASFNNMDPTEVLEKLRSGLVGEVEPLRVLGIQLDQATVKAKAMAMGLADANGEVSQAALIQARYALILEQTKNAQGDFARTSDSLANEMRIFKAKAEDAAAALGKALLPAATYALGAINDLLEGFNALPEETKRAVVGIGGLAAAAGPAAMAVGKLAEAMSNLSASAAAAGGWIAWAKGLAGTAGKVSLITAAVVALGVAYERLLRYAKEVAEAHREYEREAVTLAASARTYDEYVDAMLEAAVAKQKLTRAGAEHYRVAIRNQAMMEATYRQLGLLTKEEWEHQRALLLEAKGYDQALLGVLRYRDALKEQTAAQLAAGAAAQEAAAMQEAYQQKLDLLQQAIQGPVGQAYDDYIQRVDELRKRMSEVGQEIAALEEREARGTLWGRDKQKLEELRDEYVGLQTELDNTTAAYERQRNMILYNIASKMVLQALEQGLIRDMNNSGTAIDEAYTALLRLGQGLGLVDDKTVRVQEGLGYLVEAFSQGKLTAEEFAEQVGNLGRTIDQIPRQVDISINLQTHGQIPRFGAGGVKINVIPQARGGDWIVRKPTLFLAGEAGPERATFTPLNHAPGATGTRPGQSVVVQVTYAPTVSLADEVEMERVLGPFVVEKVKEALAVGR